jgi:hypothetical protein
VTSEGVLDCWYGQVDSSELPDATVVLAAVQRDQVLATVAPGRAPGARVEVWALIISSYGLGP